MTRLLPPLHNGHAPVFLHQAFQEALHAYEGWSVELMEPEVEFEGRAVPITSVFGYMRSCTDVLPHHDRETVKALAGDDAFEDENSGITYSEAAFLMQALAVERIRA